MGKNSGWKREPPIPVNPSCGAPAVEATDGMPARSEFCRKGGGVELFQIEDRVGIEVPTTMPDQRWLAGASSLAEVVFASSSRNSRNRHVRKGSADHRLSAGRAANSGEPTY